MNVCFRHDRSSDLARCCGLVAHELEISIEVRSASNRGESTQTLFLHMAIATDMSKHFMYWYEGGHPNGAPILSADYVPEKPEQLEAVKNFIKEVSWKNESIGKLVTLFDKQSIDRKVPSTSTLSLQIRRSNG